MTVWNNFTFYVSLTEARLTDWRQTLVVPSSWHLSVWSSGKSHQWWLKTKYLSHLTHRNGKVVRLTALYSLETLELVFNVSSEYQGCHHGRNFVKMTTFPFLCRESCSIWFYALIPEKKWSIFCRRYFHFFKENILFSSFCFIFYRSFWMAQLTIKQHWFR